MTLLEYGITHGFAATGPRGSDAPLRVREAARGTAARKAMRGHGPLCGLLA